MNFNFLPVVETVDHAPDLRLRSADVIAP